MDISKILPRPEQDEDEKDFISRFMSHEESMNDFPNRKQRFMVAAHLWENHRKSIEKRLALWGSTAGKTRVARRVVPMIPEHETYVEPFAGGAAIFYAKPKEMSKREVLSDTNPEVAFCFTFIRDMSESEAKSVRSKNWVVSKDQARRVHEMKPSNQPERFYRFAYKRYALFFGREDRITAIDPYKAGKRPTLINNLETTKERLKGVKIHNESYEKIVRAYDSKDTFYYLDPPYPRCDQSVGEKEFDEPAFIKCLQNMKGKFLLHYDYRDRSKFMGKGWNVKVISATQTMVPKGKDGKALAKPMAMAGKLLEVTNYIPAKKADKTHEAVRFFSWEEGAFSTPSENLLIPVIKTDEDEKIVTGIVLEPDEVDAQGDTVSEEAIKEAAYRFLAKFNKDTELGFMHKAFGDLGMSLIESWVAREDINLGGNPVKSGSWLMSIKVDRNEKLWKKIKSGEISGFSIGGVARVSR